MRPVHNNDLARSNIFPNNEQSKIDEHADWKSKYDILEQLKKDEKEPDSTTCQEGSFNTELDQDAANHYSKENYLTKDEDSLLEYKAEFPVKLSGENPLTYNIKNDAQTEQNCLYDNQDIDLNNSIYENNNVAEINLKPKQLTPIMNNNDENLIQTIGYDQYNIENTAYDHIPSKDIEYQLSQTESLHNDKYATDIIEIAQPISHLDINKNTNMETSGEMYSQIATEPVVPDHAFLKEEDTNNIVDTNKQICLDQVEVPLVKATNDSNINDEMNSVAALENNYNTPDTNIEYPIETINVEDYTPSEGVKLVDGENINPKPQVIVESNDLTYHYDPIVETDNVNISEHPSNTDHEGFYKENTEVYDYTEEGVAETYNTEYTAPPENYQQNEEYAYYEGGQIAHTEINENEETLQQYDQNYEQQYGAAYDQQVYQQQDYGQDYNQQEYVEPQQQYETVGQNEQDLQYGNQDNLTAQYVEQQLDNEEGYVKESPNEILEESNIHTPVKSQQIPAVVADQEAKLQ